MEVYYFWHPFLFCSVVLYVAYRCCGVVLKNLQHNNVGNEFHFVLLHLVVQASLLMNLGYLYAT